MLSMLSVCRDNVVIVSVLLSETVFNLVNVGI